MIYKSLSGQDPQSAFFTNKLPLALLGVLLIIMLTTVFSSVGDYGLSVDEELQDNYGHSVLAWYKTDHRDTSFLTAYPAVYYMPQHGASFDALIAQAQDLFGHRWYTRAIINGLAAVLGVVAIALCGYELGGYWFALLAASSLWLYPRFYGAILNNPKDIPFAVAMTFILWAVLLLMKQWEYKRRYIGNSILVGFLIGLAASIRVTSVIWYLMLALVLLIWWFICGLRTLREKKLLTTLRKQFVSLLLIGLVSLQTMIMLWPYIALNPLPHLVNAINIMQKYPWGGYDIFEGKTYYMPDLPRSYAPIWLVLGSPPTLVVLAILATVLIVGTFLRKRTFDPLICLVALALFIPLSVLVSQRAALYDALRQILFLVPPLILLAVSAFLSIFLFLLRRRQKILAFSLVCLLLLQSLLVVRDMVDLHPYEYIYFSPFAGGVAGANGKYDMDYWSTCSKASAEWLAREYQHYTTKTHPTERDGFYNFLSLTFLPDTFQRADSAPDFYISTTRFSLDKNYPTYKVIHRESRQGVTLCVVKARL